MIDTYPFKAYAKEADRWTSKDDWKDDRSRDPEHMIAHMTKVYGIPGVLEYTLASDLRRRAELRCILVATALPAAKSKARKYLARLALIARTEGWRAKQNNRRRCGAAGHLKNVIGRYRKEWESEVPTGVLDWVVQFFRLGWADRKPDRRALALADVMQRVPQVDEYGRRLIGDAASDYGADRVAMARLRKLFASKKS